MTLTTVPEQVPLPEITTATPSLRPRRSFPPKPRSPPVPRLPAAPPAPAEAGPSQHPTSPPPAALPPLFGPPPRAKSLDHYQEQPVQRIVRVATMITNTPGWGWKWFRSDLFSLLIVFAPFAIAGGVIGWPAQAVFALNALSLAGLEVFISTRLERACLSSIGPTLPKSLGLEIIPSIFPTLIGIVSLLSNETVVAKSFIIGNVLNNILLGTGAALFLGGMSPEACYNQEVSETTFELVKLSIFSTSPIIIVWAMIFVMTNKTELPSDYNGGEQLKNSTSSSTEEAVAGLSRGTAVLLLIVYIVWILFRRVTHRDFFAADDRDRRVTAEAIRHREYIPLPKTLHGEPKLKGKEGEATASIPTRKQELLYKNPFLRTVFAVGTTLLVVAAMVAAVFCSHYLVTSIDPLVGLPSDTDEESHGNLASLRRHFLASILLPLVVNLYNDLRAAELACCGGRNVTVAVHLTYGAGTASIFLTLPVLVIIGWASSHTLLLDFAAFDVSLLAGSVWATSVLTTRNVDYFRGFVFLCLYCIVALAVFMFKE